MDLKIIKISFTLSEKLTLISELIMSSLAHVYKKQSFKKILYSHILKPFAMSGFLS